MKTTILLVIPVIFFCACSKSNKSNIVWPSLPADVAGPAIQIDSFPLQIGNSWTYKIIEVYTGSPATIDSAVYTMTVVSDTVINHIRFAKITGISSATNSFLSVDSSRPTGTFYFANLSDGLHQFSSLNNVGNIDLDKTEFILRLPVKTDTAGWFSQEPDPNGNKGFATMRSWSTFVSVSVPAGNFNTVKLQFYSPTAEAYQYYSTKGLIQETQFVQHGSGRPAPGYSRIITLQSVNF